MQVNYRGFKLEAVREECATGYKLVYFSAIQISDDWVMIEEFADASNRLPSVIKVLKGRVDHYYGGKTKRVVEKLIKAPQIRKKLKEILDRMSDVCKACKGSGGESSNPCRACGGSGKVRPRPLKQFRAR